MTFTYTGDPSYDEVHEVRFLLQDTDPADPLLQDEEIEYLVASWRPVYGSLTYVAAIAAERIAARFAREVSVSGDGTTVGVSELQAKYEQLAVSLRDEHKARNGVGALPRSNGTIFDTGYDPTIRGLSFGKGYHDNPRAGSQDSVGSAPDYSIHGPV